MRAADEAIILAGGSGTRLRSVVPDLPKPLAPVQGRPFVAYLLDMLESQGLRRVVLATGYMADVVEATLGSRWGGGLDLVYAPEPSPLGTGGAIVHAAARIEGDSFFVLNGDTYLALDYPTFDSDMRALDAESGMALAQVPDVARYGALQIEDRRVIGFSEKGRSGPGFINAGVYWLKRRNLEGLLVSRAFSFETEVLAPAAARGAIGAYTQTVGFIDIGIPEDYHRAQTQQFGVQITSVLQ